LSWRLKRETKELNLIVWRKAQNGEGAEEMPWNRKRRFVRTTLRGGKNSHEINTM